jgi:hypothetical protein
MLNSFEQAIVYMIGNGILNEFKIRIDAIHQETIVQNWKTSKTSTQSSRDLSTSISHNRNFFNSLYFKLYIQNNCFLGVFLQNPTKNNV